MRLLLKCSANNIDLWTPSSEMFLIFFLLRLGLPKGTRGGFWQLWGLAPRLQPVQREEWRRWGPEYGRWGQAHREVQSKGQPNPSSSEVQASNTATAIMCLTTRFAVLTVQLKVWLRPHIQTQKMFDKYNKLFVFNITNIIIDRLL